MFFTAVVSRLIVRVYGYTSKASICTHEPSERIRILFFGLRHATATSSLEHLSRRLNKTYGGSREHHLAFSSDYFKQNIDYLLDRKNDFVKSI